MKVKIIAKFNHNSFTGTEVIHLIHTVRKKSLCNHLNDDQNLSTLKDFKEHLDELKQTQHGDFIFSIKICSSCDDFGYRFKNRSPERIQSEKEAGYDYEYKVEDVDELKKEMVELVKSYGYKISPLAI